jgi:serine/threonine protein kinase
MTKSSLSWSLSKTGSPNFGEGGMGEVYRARDTKVDRNQALNGQFQ